MKKLPIFILLGVLLISSIWLLGNSNNNISSENNKISNEVINEVAQKPKTSLRQVNVPLMIDETDPLAYHWSDYVAMAPWVTGSGARLDPYYIDGINMTFAGINRGSVSCVNISNSDKYFVLNNSVFTNKEPSLGNGIYLNNVSNFGIVNCNISGIIGTPLEDTRYGIRLENCGRSVIEGNRIKYNGFMGVSLYESSNVKIRENRITHNLVNINIEDGGIGSNNSKIFMNKFSNPTLGNIMYISSSTGNEFDNGSIGNYWDDYLGVDDDDDGIGDTPYRINQGAPFELYDNFPVWDDGSNTPVGVNVTVKIIKKIMRLNLTFEEVLEAGTTRAIISETEPEPPSGFRVIGDYIDVVTTANFSDHIIIVLHYNESLVLGNESLLKVMHWNEVFSVWKDVTTRVDTYNDIIYCVVTSLSIFTIMEEIEEEAPATVLLRRARSSSRDLAETKVYLGQVIFVLFFSFIFVLSVIKSIFIKRTQYER